ncbi:MAG: universal stress protein [Bacteroidota bacterium]
MNTIKRILFPTDFSEAAQTAFQYTLAFAKHLNASVEVIHAIAPDYSAAELTVAPTNATQTKLEISEAIIKDFVKIGQAQSETNDVLVTISESKVGNPVNIIVQEAKEKAIDLIMLGSHGLDSWIERVFGTFTTNVIEHAPCSVLVLPKTSSVKTLSKVLFASSLSKEDYRSLDAVTNMLYPFSPAYHVLHISDEGDTAISLTELSDYFGAQKPSLDVTFHESRHESVTDGLMNFIQTHHINLLSIYLPERNFFERLFTSSTTKDVVVQSDLPVLVYKDIQV